MRAQPLVIFRRVLVAGSVLSLALLTVTMTARKVSGMLVLVLFVVDAALGSAMITYMWMRNEQTAGVRRWILRVWYAAVAACFLFIVIEIAVNFVGPLWNGKITVIPR